MKAAFSYWDNRIAPVFDTTREIQLVASEAGQVVDSREVTLSAELPMQRTLQLAELGVETLICGAISKPMQNLISAYRIQVVPFVAGELPLVVQGWLDDRLESEKFRMPGCRGHKLAGSGRKDNPMNGQGRGKGRGPGMGRGNSSFAPNVIGNCLCPACGHSEPHQPGVPCMQQKCSQCGATMNRG